MTGRPNPGSGTIEIDIVPDPRRAGKMQAVTHGGKACITDYELLEEFRDVSWLRLFPRTGRTHQLRVSLQSIGHPCAIDPLYGESTALLLSRWKRTYRTSSDRSERPLIESLSLHAERLAFIHPTSGEEVTLEAPLPRDLAATLRQLRRWGAEGTRAR